MAASGSLDWGIKQGLLGYIRGLPDGTMHFNDADARELESFSFSLADASDWADGQGVLRFTGAFRSTGHFGVRMTTVIDPWIEVRGTVARLNVTRWEGRDARLEVAEFDWPESAVGGGSCSFVVAAPLLSIDGLEIFGDVYPVGTQLDSIIVTLH